MLRQLPCRRGKSCGLVVMSARGAAASQTVSVNLTGTTYARTPVGRTPPGNRTRQEGPPSDAGASISVRHSITIYECTIIVLVCGGSTAIACAVIRAKRLLRHAP